ncbi:hypothetical protein Tdes44962_MAKER05185 [Teratosphaeria destructans]|uniref:Uncharacterized protein n=1 Tax=Teratosphaeria destructans TaxID=418781 RepID=A0A9W7VYX9_9PEZI|nr:hypothetical protein Tdes44962_MAKER05185 [Teratosphaeria destructans]
MLFRSIVLTAIALLASNGCATCVHDPVGSVCDWGPDDNWEYFPGHCRDGNCQRDP